METYIMSSFLSDCLAQHYICMVSPCYCMQSWCIHSYCCIVLHRKNRLQLIHVIVYGRLRLFQIRFNMNSLVHIFLLYLYTYFFICFYRKEVVWLRPPQNRLGKLRPNYVQPVGQVYHEQLLYLHGDAEDMNAEPREGT